jgi:hypothetical protein
METFDEAHLGFHRIEALVARDQVALTLAEGCDECYAATEAWLAFLGWSVRSYLDEAFPTHERRRHA